MKYILTILVVLSAVFIASSNIFAKNIISGRLLKSNGKPLPYVEIELTPTDSDVMVIDPNLFAVSGSNGSFSFSNVPKGSFNLSINFNERPTNLSPYETRFFPNTAERDEAKVFETDVNTKFTGLVFQLPPQTEKLKITGKVLWKDKKPAANSFVFLRDVVADSEFYLVFTNKTDASGSFTLSAFENGKYQILSVYTESGKIGGMPLAFVKSEIFTLDKTTTPLSLTLKDINGSNQLLDKDVGKSFNEKVFPFSINNFAIYNSLLSASNFAG